MAALEHAPESQAVILREEIRQIRYPPLCIVFSGVLTKILRKAYFMAGDRVVLFLRQRQALDAEIVEQLGEREAARLFKDE